MNYLLKRQPSPGAIVECVLNNTKHSSDRYCFCPCCPQHRRVFRNNVPLYRNSTYLSALKVQLDRKRVLKRSENVLRRSDQTEAKKLSEMLKLMPLSSSKKLLNYRKKLLEANTSPKPLGWKSRYNVDCTKSYDPSMLNCNLELERFYKPIGKNSNHKRSSSSNFKLNEVKYRNYQKVNASLAGSNVGTSNKMDELRVFSLLQKPNFKAHEPLVEEKIEIKEPQNTVMSEDIQERLDTYVQTDDLLMKNYSILLYLHSSIDICVTNGMIKEACELFQSCRAKQTWKNIVNYRSLGAVYNSLLHALSSKGYWFLMKKVTNWMNQDNIKLNSDSFAALLHCLAKSKEAENEQFVLQEATCLLNSIFAHKISLNDIFCKTALSKEASEKILSIVREVVPSFDIQPDIMELSSDCPLIRNLHACPGNLQPQIEGIGEEEMKNLVEEQLVMEKQFYVDVKAVSRGRQGEVPISSRETIENLRKEWRVALTRGVSSLQRIEEEKFLIDQGICLHLYLSSVPVDMVVDILMETARSMIEYSRGFSPACDQFHRTLSHKIFQCYQLKKKDATELTDKTEGLFQKYASWYVNPSGPAMNSRQKWQMLIQDSDRSGQLDLQIIKWPDEVHLKLGKLLLGVIFNELKFTISTDSKVSTLPVLYTILRYRNNRLREEIKCHPVVARLFDSVGFDILHFRSEEIPMLCPPKPWISAEHGGYLFLPTVFIRPPDGVQGKSIRLNEVPVQQLYAPFDSVNALQSIPWMINEDVLDVALEVFRSGGSEELAVPVSPGKVPPLEKFTAEQTSEERREIYRKRKELVKNVANNYGLWCEALYRLSLANHVSALRRYSCVEPPFFGEKIVVKDNIEQGFYFTKRLLWMPQNCDFRGRVYPIPPLLNHVGSDLYRSLLIFAKGKPLGPKGLDWLKIHLINLTGTHKKRPIKDRLEYANEILPEILDSAENPLTGNKWWTKSEEPWQTLASCMELKKAISEPNPEMYICRFPIHQDGSCNGLQHYAALGKDLVGARSVNLTARDTPQDVYTVVASLLEQERAKDALNGVEIAKILEGFVERKVVKQTVMTTVYGVTAYGAKLQIKKRLEEFPNFPPEHIHAASVYLTNKTFFCLKQMFTSAKEIQEWFINCSSEICKKKDYVQWMTPLGLPVLQGYAKWSRATGKTEKRPDTLKQKNAFPPNFIHSLDSSHMMLTSLYCEQAGLTFASVHDCFWTHPSTVETMNRICREQFISLHSQPILEDLSQFFQKTYTQTWINDKSAEVFAALPKQGDFDIREVLNSVYFFS